MKSITGKIIHTDGGASIEQGVNTGGGDFVGRDQVTILVDSVEAVRQVEAEHTRKAMLIAGIFARLRCEPEIVAISDEPVQLSVSPRFRIAKHLATTAASNTNTGVHLAIA